MHVGEEVCVKDSGATQYLVGDRCDGESHQTWEPSHSKWPRVQGRNGEGEGGCKSGETKVDSKTA